MNTLCARPHGLGGKTATVTFGPVLKKATVWTKSQQTFSVKY